MNLQTSSSLHPSTQQHLASPKASVKHTAKVTLQTSSLSYSKIRSFHHDADAMTIRGCKSKRAKMTCVKILLCRQKNPQISFLPQDNIWAGDSSSSLDLYGSLETFMLIFIKIYSVSFSSDGMSGQYRTSKTFFLLSAALPMPGLKVHMEMVFQMRSTADHLEDLLSPSLNQSFTLSGMRNRRSVTAVR